MTRISEEHASELKKHENEFDFEAFKSNLLKTVEDSSNMDELEHNIGIVYQATQTLRQRWININKVIDWWG